MRIISIGVNTSGRHHTPLCACIGYFDGMHKGHQALIRETIELAKKNHCESAMITFDPDPVVTLKGLNSTTHITTMRQRMNLAVHFGIENIVILKFSRDMSQMEPEEFVEKYYDWLSCDECIYNGINYRCDGKSCKKGIKLWLEDEVDDE